MTTSEYYSELTNQTNTLVEVEVINDWRTSSMACVELCEELHDKTSEWIAGSINKLFEPILSRVALTRQEEKNQACKAIRAICEDAFRLRMMMRKLKTGYEVRTTSNNGFLKLSRNAGWMDAEAVEGGKDSEASDVVLYPVFGALIKCVEGNKFKVIEKAQVVLKRANDAA